MTKIEQIEYFQTCVHRFSLLMPIGDSHHHTLYIMYASRFKSPKKQHQFWIWRRVTPVCGKSANRSAKNCPPTIGRCWRRYSEATKFTRFCVVEDRRWSSVRRPPFRSTNNSSELLRLFSSQRLTEKQRLDICQRECVFVLPHSAGVNFAFRVVKVLLPTQKSSEENMQTSSERTACLRQAAFVPIWLSTGAWAPNMRRSIATAEALKPRGFCRSSPWCVLVCGNRHTTLAPKWVELFLCVQWTLTTFLACNISEWKRSGRDGTRICLRRMMSSKYDAWSHRNQKTATISRFSNRFCDGLGLLFKPRDTICLWYLLFNKLNVDTKISAFVWRSVCERILVGCFASKRSIVVMRKLLVWKQLSFWTFHCHWDSLKDLCSKLTDKLHLRPCSSSWPSKQIKICDITSSLILGRIQVHRDLSEASFSVWWWFFSFVLGFDIHSAALRTIAMKTKVRMTCDKRPCSTLNLPVSILVSLCFRRIFIF